MNYETHYGYWEGYGLGTAVLAMSYSPPRIIAFIADNQTFRRAQ